MSEQAKFDKTIQWLADGIVAYAAEHPDGVTGTELKEEFIEQVLDRRAIASGMQLIEAMRQSPVVDEKKPDSELCDIAGAFSVMLAGTYVGLAIERLVQAGKLQLVRLIEDEVITYRPERALPVEGSCTLREVYRPTYEQWLEHVS